MEFMPVVLAAGVGQKVSPLTSHYPKALLPVGNMPTVFYPLAMLERHGFQEAIVVIPRSFEDEIRTTLLDRCNIKMKLVFESINDTQLEEHGTAQTLRLVRHRIPEYADVLVVSGDLITDLNLNHLMSMFHKMDASVTMLLTTMEESRDLPVPGLDRSKQKSLEKEKKANRNMIGINESCGRVIVMEPLNDPEDEQELDPRIFQKYPEIRIRTTLSDCHLYLMRRWIIDYLAIHKDCEGMGSLRGEVLPHLVKKQFPSDSRLKKSRQWITPPPVKEPYVRLMPVSKDHDVYAHAEIPASVHRHKATLDLAEFMSPNADLGTTSRGVDLWTRSEESFPGTQNNDVIRCYAYIQESGFCMRTNTLSGYCEANNQIAKIFPQVAPQNKAHLIHPSVKVSRSTQVGPDCFIGENCKVGDKVVMKKSAVGANCTLRDKAKLSNSIIMDQATIGENCMVMNSVVCSGAVLAEKCEIKDCIVLPSTSIQPLSKHTSELLSDGDRSMD